MNDSGLLIGAILLGGGLYYYTQHKNEQAPLLPDSPTITPVLKPITTTATTTKPVVTPSPVKTTAQAPAPSTPPTQNTPVTPATVVTKWVFVDSIGGERIFAAVSDTKSFLDGYGKYPITRLPNNVEVGVASGVIKNGMVEVRTTINKKPLTFWIDSTQARILDDTQRNYFVDAQKLGRKKTVAELNAIYDYFRAI